MRRSWIFFATCLAAAWIPVPAPAEGERKVKRDVEFALVDGKPLLLDLYLPADRPDGHHPLVVWIHGGAWWRGSKESVPVKALVDDGFAIASIGYRLSKTAPFPANVHDIKAAIRFLRANAETYGLDPGKISIAGASAGGHLAALAGVSGGVEALEGSVGDEPGQPSDVAAIVSLYGASNLQTILAQSTPHGLSVRKPALKLLLGGLPEDEPDAAKLASPVSHVDADDPPLLLIHGDQDPQMPINQSHELQGRYEAVGAPATFHVVHGGAHGGEQFYDDGSLRRIAAFLQEAFGERPRKQ